LVCLLSIALRVLVLMQFVVRRNLQQVGATLKGIYPADVHLIDRTPFRP
jgi:hypothetical protein